MSLVQFKLETLRRRVEHPHNRRVSSRAAVRTLLRGYVTHFNLMRWPCLCVSLPMSTETKRRCARRRERRKFSPVIPSVLSVLSALPLALHSAAAVAPPDGAMCIFTDGPIRPPRRLRIVDLSCLEEPFFAIFPHRFFFFSLFSPSIFFPLFLLSCN